MVLEAIGGNLTIYQLDGAGAELFSARSGTYTRGIWQDLTLSFIGDRLQVLMDGLTRFEDTIIDSPAAGVISIETKRGDFLRIDDCLITRSATSRDAGAGFAFALQESVLQRDFRLLRSDLDEPFNDVHRTDVWWIGGTNAAGQFTVDTSVQTHQQFLRMTHEGRPTWRLFRDDVGVAMFGAGDDSVNFRDSTDLYITVDVRFPVNTSGTAWLGVRTTPTITGADLNGYRIELNRQNDGSTIVVVRYQDAIQASTFFEGDLPSSSDEDASGWINIIAISFEDKLAFFANGRFITAIDNAIKFGGTLALGVDEGTTADFDELIIRDTSPHGEG
jgi:hypothetical protein